MKYFTLLFFALCCFIKAQKTPLEKRYEYVNGENQSSMKAKTYMYIAQHLKTSDFKVKSENIGNTLTVNCIGDFENTKIEFNSKYSFFDNYYTATLENTYFTEKEKNKTTKVDEDTYPQLLKAPKNITFLRYEEFLKD